MGRLISSLGSLVLALSPDYAIAIVGYALASLGFSLARPGTLTPPRPNCMAMSFLHALSSQQHRACTLPESHVGEPGANQRRQLVAFVVGQL